MNAFFRVLLVFHVFAENSQYAVIDCKEDHKGREDKGSKETGSKSEEDDIGQGDQNHQWPDVEEDGGQLWVWVRFVSWP